MGSGIIHANVMVTELPFDASGEVRWGDSHTMVWGGETVIKGESGECRHCHECSECDPALPNFHSANQHKLALPQRNPCNKFYYGMTSKFEMMLCQLFFLPVTITLMLEMRTILKPPSL